MENTADVEYYTTYPKTPEKKAGNPVEHARTRGNPFGDTSLPVALSVMRNDTFCTTVLLLY